MALLESFEANGASYCIAAAKTEDLSDLMRFYGEVIDSIAGTESDPQWELGVHPSEKDLADAIAAGTLWVCWMQRVDANAEPCDAECDATAGANGIQDEGWSLASAMIVNDDQACGYEKARWSIDADPDEVAVVHLFATHPSCRKQGIGTRMLAFAAKIARERGARTIRLDVISGNEGVRPVYEKAGFSLRGTYRLDYEDVHDVDFYLYDMLL